MILSASAFVAEPELLGKLWEHATPLNCIEGAKLFRQGDDPKGLFVLHSGEATMTLENDHGSAVTRLRMGSGSLLGLPALVGDQPYSMSATALKGASVGFLNREEFSKLMLSEPLLGLMILRVLAAEVRTAREAISERQSRVHRSHARKRKSQPTKAEERLAI